ncbi:MAG: polyphosphate kinase 1 [Candidatus Omnitrophica bacterium]|nr:polyphosphate kinase 1 [Candidatus Omnitrophota bacterium]
MENRRFIHRDLSWLLFNERVLEESLDTTNPLLERARFLGIFSNNLDEFWMVRIGRLKRLVEAGYNKKDAYGYYAADAYGEIKETTHRLTRRLYDAYAKTRKELTKNKIFLRAFEELTNEQKKFTRSYFDTSIFPIITPVAVDQSHPFPVLPSKTIAFAVTLTRYDKSFFAVIPLPSGLPRLQKLPSEKDEFNFILIEEIIRQRLEEFFRGYKLKECALFRVIRDSELSVDEEETPDLLRAIEDGIKKRPTAKIVSLELEKTAPAALKDVLSQAIGVPPEDTVTIKGDMDLSFLFELYGDTPRLDLQYPSFTPAASSYEDIFEEIKSSDFLLHLPYQSFQPTVDLINAASADPGVLGIKMTLYRTDAGSRIISALKEAAKNKKQVTVLVEIKARFDEAQNIDWARELEEAGCHVIYGIPAMKIHSKITLIVRREEGRIRRYVHLSTGNYNEKTARIYTDIGYFTANDDFARDISDIFNVITGYSLSTRWKRIISSPHDLREYFFELIDQEIECQKKYRNGLILAKMNSLEDTQMIEKLYEASAAGVRIKLIVRGICCLIPGETALSEHIKVKSIVGRFLEHSRIFLFNNNSDYRVFLSSADWMARNLDKRIELLFEATKDDLREHLKSVLETYWKDEAKSRLLQPDGAYIRTREGPHGFNAQDYFLSLYAR